MILLSSNIKKAAQHLLDLFRIRKHPIPHLGYCSSPFTEIASFEWGLEQEGALQPALKAAQAALTL